MDYVPTGYGTSSSDGMTKLEQDVKEASKEYTRAEEEEDVAIARVKFSWLSVWSDVQIFKIKLFLITFFWKPSFSSDALSESKLVQLCEHQMTLNCSITAKGIWRRKWIHWPRPDGDYASSWTSELKRVTQLLIWKMIILKRRKVKFISMEQFTLLGGHHFHRE